MRLERSVGAVLDTTLVEHVAKIFCFELSVGVTRGGVWDIGKCFRQLPNAMLKTVLRGGGGRTVGCQKLTVLLGLRLYVALDTSSWIQ